MARYLQVDPETALNGANRKFSKRYQAMKEYFASQGRPLNSVNLEEMDQQWQKQKESVQLKGPTHEVGGD